MPDSNKLYYCRSATQCNWKFKIIDIASKLQRSISSKLVSLQFLMLGQWHCRMAPLSQVSHASDAEPDNYLSISSFFWKFVEQPPHRKRNCDQLMMATTVPQEGSAVTVGDELVRYERASNKLFVILQWHYGSIYFSCAVDSGRQARPT